MMNSSNLWILHFLLAITLLPLGSAIQCYYCSTASDLRCIDTSQFYSQKHTGEPSDCTQEAVDTTLSRIRKNLPSPVGEVGNYDCIKVELMINNNITIVRGCAQAQTRRFDPCTDLRSRVTNPGDIVYCSICKEDGCNASTRLMGLQAELIFGSLFICLKLFK